MRVVILTTEDLDVVDRGTENRSLVLFHIPAETPNVLLRVNEFILLTIQFPWEEVFPVL